MFDYNYGMIMDLIESDEITVIVSKALYVPDDKELSPEEYNLVGFICISTNYPTNENEIANFLYNKRTKTLKWITEKDWIPEKIEEEIKDHLRKYYCKF